jgi:putative ATP-dependent endonuclease of the OLD family
MKIRRLVLENVTSYEHRTEFQFDDGLNIFIGPNGGGKSNLQKTIAVVLTHYFVHQWQVKQEEERTHLEKAKTYQKKQLRSLLSTYGDNEDKQIIEIELIPEAHDIENIKAIGGNLGEINNALQFYEIPYATYEPLDLLSEIEDSGSFLYRIVDRELEAPKKGTGAYGFLRYLNDFFIFMRVATSIPNVVLSAPIFFFSSERALTKGFEIQAGNLTEDNYLSGYQSAFNAATGQTNLLQWGSQHFVRLYRRSLWKAGNSTESHFQDFLRKEPDVILLDKYLGMLGYGWHLEHDEEQTKFRLGLTRGKMTFFSEIFSSGEREIIHFLVSLFALNVRDGLILVDEPELHLHPRWQRMFLRLFKELAPERNNQFIIATHSPVFVSPDTIQNVIRTYRRPNEGSCKVALREMEELPSKKQLVRMINSQNNERLFFADKVILVEGITDRVVIGSLVELALEHFKDSRSVEVIDVGGKHNFKEYQHLLDGLETPWAVVADRDYLEQIGGENVKSLFVVDRKSQAKALLDDKKSLDRNALVESLKHFINNGEKEKVLGILEYMDSRHKALKSELTDDERIVLESEIRRLSEDGIELLKHGGGEIEDYMPRRLTDIGDVVELVSNNNWIIDIDDETTRVHLGTLVGRILDVGKEQLGQFVEDIRQRKEVFEKVQ